MAGVNRRDFLRRAVSGSLGLAGVPALAAGARGDNWQPNILFAISDDQSWAHAGAYRIARGVNTPAFDRVAREGVLFANAYVSAPSCCPSRGAILTGQAFWRLAEGCMNHGTLSKALRVYPSILETAGYHVGYTGKGWGPGSYAARGWRRNPVGLAYHTRKCSMPRGMSTLDYAANFDEFLKARPASKPFCFWYGSHEPHRGYKKGHGLESGKMVEDATAPPFLPDKAEVRADILDYYAEIERFDRDLGRMIYSLERAGELDNTLIVVTSDNGMPFPRAKAQLYDYGTRVPLAVRWPAKVPGGRAVDDFISLTDLAPTLLEAARLKPLPEMTGRSFLDVLTSSRSGRVDATRDRAFFGKERHHPQSFEDGLGYASRAVRTRDFLYIRNYRPERPASGDPGEYRDTDTSPTKTFMIRSRRKKDIAPLFRLAFGKRPAEELYDLLKDPGQMTNVVGRPEYADALTQLRETLTLHLTETNDPRALGKGEVLDAYCDVGTRRPKRKKRTKKKR